MPFIPHTEPEIREMLSAIGVARIDDLFDEIPEALRRREPLAIAEGLSEMEVTRVMEARAATDGSPVCFIGAGAYDHYIPAAVWRIASRGEFYTAYTPYQAEASQGTLQLLYEYQSMMTALMGMAVSNASLYDGASGLAEAILMAVRQNRGSKSKKVLVPRALHPHYRRAAHNIVHNQGIELIEVPYDPQGGHTPVEALAAYKGQDITALVIPQPNFFGVLEDVDALIDWARENRAISIAVVNPLAMSILAPPGEWGEQGADIACGEGQPLGIPLASGGPYFGFLCCKQELVRQMPGRLVGRTLDLEGKPGFTLTLQPREQHIRRAKATSNICTNQGLMVTAATIHMALMGAEGLARAAATCHTNTQALVDRLTTIEGVASLFNRPMFHEAALRLPIAPSAAHRTLAAYNLLGGLDLSRDYPELGDAILVCATERRTAEEMELFREKLERVIETQGGPKCRLRPAEV